MLFPRLFLALAVLSGAAANTIPLTSVRSINGTDRADEAGAAEEVLWRMSSSLTTYPDMVGEEMWNNTNPRYISKILMKETATIENDRNLLDMVWQWGQFLDHDIDLTEGAESYGNMTIPIPDDSTDPFIIANCTEINLVRSEYEAGQMIGMGHLREQVNDITSFIDGSAVYGSNSHRELMLRVGTDSCYMKTSENGTLLPKNVDNLENAGGTGSEFFVAGDIRANEQVGLTAMHTLFVREHNLLCDDIITTYPNSTAEQQYQMARKIVGAEIQVITYKEFLPALLGSMAPDLDGYTGYNESVIPSIANEFSTAAYRFGHTMLSGSFTLANSAGPFGDPIELKDVFFDADFFDGNPLLVDHILGGLQEGLAKEIDPMLTDAVRDFLFGTPNGPDTCLDLAALNIQRGRDHGIPSYNDLRNLMGLGSLSDFTGITANVDRQNLLATVYDNVDKVDAWVGMLSEDHMPGASVGPLLGAMLKDQFDRLMYGDPFFYKGDNDLKDPILKANVMDVESVTLQKIIGRNTIIVYPETQSAFVRDTTVTYDWPLSNATRSFEGEDREDGLGAAHTPLIRLAPDYMITYEDGKEEMTIGISARLISNAVFDQDTSITNDRGMLDMVWQWGQFLDHDIDLTEGAAQYGQAVIYIPMIDEDPFIIANCTMIAMDRSEYTYDNETHIRMQVNDITAFIDASNVYGSDSARAMELRTLEGGKLKASENGLLPKNTAGLTNAPDTTDAFFLAGDIRANEQAGLLAMHTLFVREHNRLADDIGAFYPGRTDEEIYQLARKIVGAEMQAITYKEFLPALLGPMAPDIAGYNTIGYNASVDPSIANEFSTFAFRVGHTMLSGNLVLANSQGPFGTVALRDLFFDPTPFDEDHFFVDHILGGLMEQFCQEVDAYVVDDVRNFLFGAPDGPGTCMDLAAINIERGKDHGLPLYNDMREMMQLTRYTHFENITSDPDVAAALQSVYHTVDHIDAWVGGLAEDHVANASVGELVGNIIKDQFERLMYGDPFFYRGDNDLFDEDLMLNIMNVEEVTLQLIISRNTNLDPDPSVSAFVAEAVKQLGVLPLTANRSIDGTDRDDDLGAADVQLLRMSNAVTYTDGVEAMYSGPNAREVSNAIFKQTDTSGNHVDVLNSNGLLDMVWQWGQFLDHDIGLTEPVGDVMTIPIPQGDYFASQGCQGIEFQRSISMIVNGRREQINEITSFIDGSAVYGSDAARAAALRTFEKGELKTSQNGLNLPYNFDGLMNAGGNQNTSFVAGDIRANEQIGLIAMHTLFVREHNRLADLIGSHYSNANDEQIYQLARKIVSAEIQAVTYKEFLPALLGPFAPDLGSWNGYDSSVDPTLANEFSGALYRFGHSMISPQLLMSFDGLTAQSNMSLASSFFSPEIYLANPYTTDMLLGGLMLQDAQKVDTKIIDNLRMFLFQAPDASGCMDLAAFNIQRGRDHGIPFYNDLREMMGLPRKSSFADITLDTEVRAQLAAVYPTVDDVEAWVGALAENHVIGGNVGELLAHVMKDQFERLMHGDKFFWLGDTDLQDTELKTYIMDVDNITLAQIIDLNTILARDPSQSAFVRGESMMQSTAIPLSSTRTIDGSDRPDFKGEADVPLARMSYDKMTYTDDQGTMMTSTNPRRISTRLFRQGATESIKNARGMLDMVWQWGQFIDHDISLTEGGVGFGEANISIPQLSNDLFFQQGCPHIHFTRSRFVNNPIREQVNEITAFLDASMVYGSDAARAAELRTMSDGKLKTSSFGLNLPFNENGLENAGGTGSTLFLAGDIRANEQMGLIAMHTLFVREHNRLAGLILDYYPTATDEEVYQLARKLVAAEIQKITYDEFLPALMGSNAPVLNKSTWAYDSSVDPSIMSEFSTAMFRVGHSMISAAIPMSWGPGWGGFVWFEDLKGSFFETHLFSSNAYTTDQIMGGLVANVCQEIDTKVVDDLRDFLFGENGATGCLDLVALNIQRGRDHGIPLYNDLREAAGLPRKNSIAEITTVSSVRNALNNLYQNDVNRVDAWVGGLAETHVPGASLGELMLTVIKDQFERLAYGDPKFYLGDQDVWDAGVRSFILDIEELTMAKVIEFNTIISRDSSQSAFMSGASS